MPLTIVDAMRFHHGPAAVSGEGGGFLGSIVPQIFQLSPSGPWSMKRSSTTNLGTGGNTGGAGHVSFCEAQWQASKCV